MNPRSRGVLSNAGWNAFGTLFSISITFLTAPVVIHHLGVDQWGLLILVWSVTGVLGMANFGVGEATLRFIARYHADGNMAGLNRVFGSTLTFYLAICTVISILLFFVAPTVAQWLEAPADERYPVAWLLRLAAPLFTLGMITNAFRSVPMAMHRYDISNKIGLYQSIARTVGVLAIVVAGMGALHVLAWEVAVAFVMLGVQALVARRLLPEIRCFPTMSLSGMREIFGYGVFSFLTNIFLTMYRESGKLILGNRVGPASVAYLGTPDSVAYRLHMIVVSGVETLMPRFSACRDLEASKSLLVASTWVAVACGVVLYLPLAVLMPDLLRLWISPEFAQASALVGQLLAISFIAPAAFAPIATLFRGMGKPGFVTFIMAGAGVVVLVSSLVLVSSQGPAAVGYGYVFSGVAWLGGLFGGWFYLFGRQSFNLLLRAAALPLVIGAGMAVVQMAFRARWGEMGWTVLFIIGGVFACVNAIALLAADRALGGDSPAEQLLERVLRADHVMSIRRGILARVLR